MDPILSELNDPQREAILHEEGPLLVIAGAGSGKTRVITRRIAHLVRLGHAPGSILGVTFTNKAAGEMKERVDMLAGSQGVFISTFHSMGARFLRVDGERIGIPRNFTIYDGDDQKALIKDVLKALNLDPTHFRPPAVAEAISRLKTRGTSPEEAAFSGNYFERQVGEVYARYKEQLTANRSLDFDDLLLETLRLFKECDEVRARYQDRFRFILIDEYQDTNKVQYELAKALTGPRMNLCATGDPDQSIYSWRGARVQNILNFEKDFSGTKVIKLEQNYRSTGNILKAASSVIAHNAYRMERNLWTEAPDGDPLTLYSARDEGEEAEFVVRALTELRLEGKPYSESAIFYRTNALSRAFERALSINNIPYTIVGSVAFYERKEIKDLMAYLKLINNPQDSVSFLRIINMPARGIGMRTLNQVREMAILQGKSLLETVRKICDERLLSARPVSAMAKFLKIFDTLCEHPRESVEGLLRQVMEDTGYMNYLQVLEKKESVERVENVNELIYATGEYDRHNPEGSLHGYLEETALIQGIDSWEGDQDKVVLMTLHTAKGLEFNSVFLAGVEEGLMPHMLSLKSDEDLEEERRLFYVGITRARKKLHLSCSASRMRNGSITASRPSRFLQELPEEAVQGNSFARAFSGRVSAYAGQAPAPSPVPDPFGGEDAEPVLEYDQGIAPDFKRGDRVIHPYFGQGQILQVSGSGENARVKVRFQGIGEKLLIVKYAKLKKVL